VVLNGKQKFTHTWMRRLYDCRASMIRQRLMFASKHFPDRAGRKCHWQLTPLGVRAAQEEIAEQNAFC
jgi:hypothetical protein